MTGQTGPWRGGKWSHPNLIIDIGAHLVTPSPLWPLLWPLPPSQRPTNTYFEPLNFLRSKYSTIWSGTENFSGKWANFPLRLNTRIGRLELILCWWLFIFIFLLFLYFISLDHLVGRLNFDIQFVKINIRRCISIYIMIPGCWVGPTPVYTVTPRYLQDIVSDNCLIKKEILIVSGWGQLYHLGQLVRSVLVEKQNQPVDWRRVDVLAH